MKYKKLLKTLTGIKTYSEIIVNIEHENDKSNTFSKATLKITDSNNYELSPLFWKDMVYDPYFMSRDKAENILCKFAVKEFVSSGILLKRGKREKQHEEQKAENSVKLEDLIK